MTESIFVVSFPSTTLAAIQEVMKGVAPEADIRERVTFSGDDEITIKNNLFDFHAHSSVHGGGPGTEYLGSGEYFGSMDELRAFVEKLASRFAAKGILYDFEIYEETPGGEQIGESETIRHPEYR